MLARRFGDFVAAARELERRPQGPASADLAQSADFESCARADGALFTLLACGLRLLEAVYSGSAKRRRWAADAMSDAIGFSDDSFAQRPGGSASAARRRVAAGDSACSGAEKTLRRSWPASGRPRSADRRVGDHAGPELN